MTSEWHMRKILFWFDKTNTWTVARDLAIYAEAFVVSSDMLNGTTIASHTTDRLDAPYNYSGILTVA